MSEYTPTTEEIREYVTQGGDPRPWVSPDDPEEVRLSAGRAAAFDRWLAARDREVAAKAWDEGARHVYTEGGKCSFARDGDPCPYNPYREGN